FGHLTGGVDWTLLAVGAAASVPGAHGDAAAGVPLVDAEDVANGADELELPAGEVPLRLVQQLLRLAVLTRHAGQRQARTLPQLMVVDLGNRNTESVLQLCLRRLDVLAFALERARLGKVQLDAQDPDVARAHA